MDKRRTQVGGEVLARHRRDRRGLHEAEQVMPEQIGPDDAVPLPEDVFKTLHRVIQLLRRGEVNLLVFQARDGDPAERQ